jgi:hypothetical protein
MNQAHTPSSRISSADHSSAVILVMPGRLCRQVDNSEFGAMTPWVIDSVGRLLSQFNGDICGIVVDSETSQLCLYPALTTSFCALADRSKSHAIVHADHIDERDRTRSALAIAKQIIAKTGLVPGRDTICLTGAGWDGTDQPTDLLCYAFRGLGFCTIMDPQLRMIRRAAGARQQKSPADAGLFGICDA